MQNRLANELVGGVSKQGASLTAADTARRRGEQREVGATAAPSNNVSEEEEDKVLVPRRMRIREKKFHALSSLTVWGSDFLT